MINNNNNLNGLNSVSATTISATTFYGDGSNLTGVSGGGTFTGGTVSGDTHFTGQLQIGNVGYEGSGININGLTFDSSFKVSDIDGANYAQNILHRHSTTLEPVIVGARSNSDNAGHTGVTNNMNTFTIYGAGWNTDAYNLNGQITIATNDTGTLSSTSSPGKISLYTTPNGSVWPELAVNIDSDKNMKVYGNITGDTISANSYVGLPSGSFGITIDGGGSAVTTGVKGYVEMPYAGTITSWTILADQSGSAVIDLWKTVYAGLPAEVGDSITASAKPTLSSSIKGQSSTLTGWTTAVAAGDIIAFNVVSASASTRITLSVTITKS